MRGLLFLAIGLVLTCPAAAQEVTMSVFGGLAATTFVSDAETAFDPGVAPGGGFGLGYDTGLNVSAQVELLYIVKSASADLLLGDVPSRVRFQYTDVEIPAYVTLRLPVYWRVVPVALGGASVAFNRNAHIRYRALAGGPAFDEMDRAATDRTYSFLVGVGAEIPLGTERLFFHARLHLGRTDVREQTSSLRHRTLFLAVGFRTGL